MADSMSGTRRLILTTILCVLVDADDELIADYAMDLLAGDEWAHLGVESVDGTTWGQEPS